MGSKNLKAIAVIFTFGAAIRLVLLVDQVYHEIVDAQKLRAHDIESMSFFEKIKKGYSPIFLSLMLSLLRKASDLDVAIESRGFGNPTKRAYLEEIGLRQLDYIAIVLTTIFMVFMLGFSMLYGRFILFLPT